MKLEEIKARAEAAEYAEGACGDEYNCGLCGVIADLTDDIPALIAEVERLQKENLSFHAIATEHYEETVRLKAQLEAEILRRDSLDETLNNVLADHKAIRKAAEELIDAADPQISEIALEFRKYITALAEAIKEENG